MGDITIGGSSGISPISNPAAMYQGELRLQSATTGKTIAFISAAAVAALKLTYGAVSNLRTLSSADAISKSLNQYNQKILAELSKKSEDGVLTIYTIAERDKINKDAELQNIDNMFAAVVENNKNTQGVSKQLAADSQVAAGAQNDEAVDA